MFHFLIDVLETLFVIGGLGSALVLVLSAIEDIETVLSKDAPITDEATTEV